MTGRSANKGKCAHCCRWHYKLHLKLKDGTIKDLEINAYIFQYENAKNVKDEINVKIRAITEELNLVSLRLDESNEQYLKAMDKLSEIDKEIEKAHEMVLKLTVEIEQQSGEIRVIRERINNLNLQKDKLNLDVLNANNAIIKGQAELEYKTEKQK